MACVCVCMCLRTWVWVAYHEYTREIGRQPWMAIILFHVDTSSLLCCTYQADWPVSIWGFSCLCLISYHRSPGVIHTHCVWLIIGPTLRSLFPCSESFSVLPASSQIMTQRLLISYRSSLHYFLQQISLVLWIYILPCGFLPFILYDWLPPCLPDVSSVPRLFFLLPLCAWGSPAYTYCLTIGCPALY